MQGKIIKGIAGFYYVHVPGKGIYECRARGIFRKDGVKPLTGDNCLIEQTEGAGCTGSITGLLDRKNELVRPPVSNVDQALVIFAAARPAPNLNLLDRFLVMMGRQGVDTIICFNKTDAVEAADRELLEETYSKCGGRVVFISAKKNQGIGLIKELTAGKTTVLAGPSGVGKSTLINLLVPKAQMETGEISLKIDRGRHTTRHCELFCMEEGTYLMDTPGFSSLYLPGMEKEDLKDYFKEFAVYGDMCRFQGCSHIHEPGCAVKAALSEGKISRLRYGNYVLLYEELSRQKKYG